MPKSILIEQKLLLYCSKTHPNTITTKKIKLLLKQNINWQYLLKTAKKNKILPLLYHNLNNICPTAIPTEIILYFHKFFEANTKHNLLLVSETIKVLKLLAENNISAIPLKGAVLANLVYGNFNLRTISDIDIIVRETDFKIAENLLLKYGYKASSLNKPEYNQQAQYYQPNNSIYLDLHYQFTPKNYFVTVNSDFFWQNTQIITLANYQITFFTKEALLIYLCLEGLKEHWRKINRICDIAETIEHHNIDWDLLLNQAKSLNQEGILLLGLFLAKEVLEVSIPQEIEKKINSHLKIKLSQSQISQFLFRPQFNLLLAWKWHLFKLQIFKSLSGKLKYWLIVLKLNYQTRIKKL